MSIIQKLYSQHNARTSGYDFVVQANHATSLLDCVGTLGEGYQHWAIGTPPNRPTGNATFSPDNASLDVNTVFDVDRYYESRQ